MLNKLAKMIVNKLSNICLNISCLLVTMVKVVDIATTSTTVAECLDLGKAKFIERSFINH